MFVLPHGVDRRGERNRDKGLTKTSQVISFELADTNRIGMSDGGVRDTSMPVFVLPYGVDRRGERDRDKGLTKTSRVVSFELADTNRIGMSDGGVRDTSMPVADKSP